MCVYLFIFSFRIEEYFSICQLCPTFQMHSYAFCSEVCELVSHLRRMTCCLYTVCTEGQHVVYTQFALKDGTFIHSLH